ncbi:MAG: peptide deformylase [Phycisphaeraceae bacterium]
MPVDPLRLRIVKYPDPVLRQPADPVGEVSDEVRGVAHRMLALMHEAPGVGLAAPQVGLSWRMFVANPTGEPGNDRVFINPEIVDASRDVAAMEEGCLSLPEIRGEVQRPRRVTVRAIGLDGEPFELTSEELPARVWQHENDHLDGVLIIDKMTRMDRLANRRPLKALEADA